MKYLKAKALIGLCQCAGCRQRAASVLKIKKGGKVCRLIVCVDHAWEWRSL